MQQLVLLHGWGMNRHVWDLIEPELAFNYDGEILALDLPGFGESAMSENQSEHYDLHFMAEQLASKIEDNAVIVGWSLGGLVALYLAKHFPHKVSRVVLVASTPLFAQTQDWPGIKPQVLADFNQQLIENSKATIERFLAIQAMGSATARQDSKALKKLLSQQPNASEWVLKQGLDILENQDLRQTFSELAQPVSGIFGRLDALVPYKAIAQMQQLRSDFDITVLDKASHAPFISHKEEFISALRTSLKI